MSGAGRGRGISRRGLLGGVAGLGAAALAGVRPGRARARSERPPGIVFILSDNHRFDAMGSMPGAFVRTPHLDRLGREGLHFADAFCTTPLCSPARASFLTGLYAYRHGVSDNSTRAAWDERNVTLLELLQREAGYATAFIGKWHMPGSGLPRLRGVDHFVTFTSQGGQGRYLDCPLIVDGQPAASRHPYVTTELTDRAIAWLETVGDRPFCLYLSHKAVHAPWRPAPEDEGLYTDAPVPLPPDATMWTGYTNGQIWGGFTRPIPEAYRAYMATVTSLDREIGRLLAYLDTRGLADDTVVMYASDNGFLFGEHAKVELRWPFEEALRIPFLVRAPRQLAAPGRRPAQMALNIDVAPTLLALAGVTPPADMQGMSLVPVLRDPAARGRQAWLVEQRQEFPYRTPSYQGVRTRTHLYVEYEDVLPPTLHDVARDPTQSTDLMGTPEGERLLPALRGQLAALRRGERLDG